VLLHRCRDDHFWALPGGTIEPGELSDETLCREIAEELSLTARAVRLLWVTENRFTYQQRRFHEIGFYWLLDVAGYAWPEHDGKFVASEGFIFRWAAMTDLAALTIKPNFLRNGIKSLPTATVHLQIDD
jgi:8-oxo-dGTP pyrophosphatase MutT (NUDIX family)